MFAVVLPHNVSCALVCLAALKLANESIVALNNLSGAVGSVGLSLSDFHRQVRSHCLERALQHRPGPECRSQEATAVIMREGGA